MNHAKNFIVWANEEDHIRIISMQKGASLKQVWSRLVRVRLIKRIKV
jgi:creatine kinase